MDHDAQDSTPSISLNAEATDGFRPGLPEDFGIVVEGIDQCAALLRARRKGTEQMPCFAFEASFGRHDYEPERWPDFALTMR